MPAIPAGPSELTSDWLTAALRASGVIQAGAVSNLTTEIIGADRGFTGVVARVNLTYDQPAPDAPSSLVAKLPLAEPDGSSYRDAQQVSPEQMQYVEWCAREVRFYQDLASGIALMPVSYGGWVDAENERIVLLLEDLSGGDAGDALLGCSIDRVEIVIDRLASFHARWWGQAPAWLPRWGGDLRGRAERFRGQLSQVLDRHRDRIPEATAALSLELAQRYESVLRRLALRPVTVIHGDLHLDNLIFTGDDGVALIDWQNVSAGPAIVDLGLFIVGALSVDDRRTAEMDLLARYHLTLESSGVRDYSFADLVADYRRSLVWQLAGITGWLARVDLASLEGRERALVEALFTPGQVFAACHDHAEWLTTPLP